MSVKKLLTIFQQHRRDVDKHIDCFKMVGILLKFLNEYTHYIDK